jgi:hypothetical protein
LITRIIKNYRPKGKTSGCVSTEWFKSGQTIWQLDEDEDEDEEEEEEEDDDDDDDDDVFVKVIMILNLYKNTIPINKTSNKGIIYAIKKNYARQK